MIKLNKLLINAERFTSKTTKSTLIGLRKWFKKRAENINQQSDAIINKATCRCKIIINQNNYSAAEKQNFINEHRVFDEPLVKTIPEENADNENLRNEWKEILLTLNKNN